MLVTMLVILCWSSAARVIMLVTTLVILCWPSAATAYLRALGWRTGTARILSRELPRKLDSKRPNSSAAWASLHLQGRGGGGRTCVCVGGRTGGCTSGWVGRACVCVGGGRGAQVWVNMWVGRAHGARVGWVFG